MSWSAGTKRGPKGETGDPGAAGQDGLTGSAGTNGKDGLPGAAGRDGAAGTNGTNGKDGSLGPPNSLAIGSVSTLAAGSQATANITGAAPSQTLALGLPQGAPGASGRDGKDGAPGASIKGDAGSAGPPNTLSIGTVTTGAAGSQTAAAISGTSPNQTLSLTIPRGADGAPGKDGAPGSAGTASSLTVGTVTTGSPGSSASATVTGTAPVQTLSLAIPRGDAGSAGAAGVSAKIGIPATAVAVVSGTAWQPSATKDSEVYIRYQIGLGVSLACTISIQIAAAQSGPYTELMPDGLQGVLGVDRRCSLIRVPAGMWVKVSVTLSGLATVTVTQVTSLLG